MRHVGRSHLVFYLFFDGSIALSQTPLILSAVKYEYAKHLLFVSVYEIRAGSTKGALIGMAFHSPHKITLDKYFALFHRNQSDISKNHSARQRYEIKDLVIFIMEEDDAVLINAGPRSDCALLPFLE